MARIATLKTNKMVTRVEAAASSSVAIASEASPD